MSLVRSGSGISTQRTPRVSPSRSMFGTVASTRYRAQALMRAKQVPMRPVPTIPTVLEREVALACTGMGPTDLAIARKQPCCSVHVHSMRCEVKGAGTEDVHTHRTTVSRPQGLPPIEAALVGHRRPSINAATKMPRQRCRCERLQMPGKAMTTPLWCDAGSAPRLLPGGTGGSATRCRCHPMPSRQRHGGQAVDAHQCQGRNQSSR